MRNRTRSLLPRSFERTPDRLTQRNGTHPRSPTIAAGELELGIPNRQAGSFLPSLLERRSRVDQVPFAVVMEAHVHEVGIRGGRQIVRLRGSTLD